MLTIAGHVKRHYGAPDLEQQSLFPNSSGTDDQSKLGQDPAIAPNEPDSQSRPSPATNPQVPPPAPPALQVFFGDNVTALGRLPVGHVDLIYIDPPFNTGKTQRRHQIKAVQSPTASRRGFQGRTYKTSVVGTREYSDYFTDYVAFLEPRLVEAYRVLAPHGSLYLHVDYREVHRCRFLLDDIFGADNFVNEIIWAYDFGGRPKDRWPAKHDNILFYVKNRARYTFNRDAIERIPYMAPGLVGADKAARGKLPTDTWWHTIVPTNSREKTGYPTQKPAGILRRIVAASSNPGDLVLDFFAGSGTTGAVAHEMRRRAILVDSNPEAIDVMRRRFAHLHHVEWTTL